MFPASPAEMSETSLMFRLQTLLPGLDNRRRRLHAHHRRHLLTEAPPGVGPQTDDRHRTRGQQDEEEASSETRDAPHATMTATAAPGRGRRVQRPGTSERKSQSPRRERGHLEMPTRKLSPQSPCQLGPERRRVSVHAQTTIYGLRGRWFWGFGVAMLNAILGSSPCMPP